MRKEIIIIIGALIIGTAIYFKPVLEPRIVVKNPVIEHPTIEKNEVTVEKNELVLDLTDRENGICADMYAQGFDWGLQQIPLQTWIWRNFDEKSESEIKELLYDHVKTLYD